VLQDYGTYNELIHKKLFSDKHFGSINGCYTLTQLLNIPDEWTKCSETGGQVDVIYTDFENI
jgi:hypothetical protein